MKKIISILLTIIMLFTMVPVSVFAVETTKVNLVSFMRGDVNDLRSSELLEVQVEGYNGNPRELTYKWTSSLGTYLYIYNSHNMYGINNTYGEYEIYNSDKKISRNSNVEVDRAGDKTLTKEGFMWASVYGAYEYSNISAKDALKGTVTVEVFDKNGTKLGADSFSSFKAHNLDSDLDNVVIGLFEGDRVNVLDLLGQSGIVHITCEQSSVSGAKVLSGDDHILVEPESKGFNTYNYFVKGVKAGDNSENGDAQLEIKIKKDVCKFHYKTSGNANPIVYVFKKPKTSTTTTTLTLVSDIDNRCEYFINGNKGEKQTDGTILFTGLDPNTTYTVEVRAEYNDNGKTKYVYGYVEDTTKPAYKATVKTYLDNTITDIEGVHGNGVELLLSKDGKNFVELTKIAIGTYEAVVENGTYFLWHYEDGIYHQARNYELIIEHANAELNMHHYSVNYDTNGGSFKTGEEVDTEVYSSMSAANATKNIPILEGYVFVGWEYDNAIYAPGAQITASISAPITLKAKWEKEVNVTINVIVDHRSNDGGFDPDDSRADLDIGFLEMTAGSPAFIETGDKLYFRDGTVTDENGNEKDYKYELKDKHVSYYTAFGYTYTNLLESSAFGVSVSKSGYDVGTIEKIQDENGNWTINVPLTYTPSNFDFNFSVEMEKDVPRELYPDAVIVKVAYWNKDLKEWKIISQQETTDEVVRPGVRVDIDLATGRGSGSYPVWKYDGDNEAYGYRAVVTGFIYDGSTIIVPTEKDHTKENGLVVVTYTDGNYTATMSDIADGNRFSTSLNGAYYNAETDAQQGTVHGVITVEKYDVIFDANGGKINGGDTYTETDNYYVPDMGAYVPTFDGHEFGGWYKDADFKEPAVAGELLTENVTLYAKWDRVLTGSVRVAGYYLQNGVIVDIWSIDRAESAVVVLQEITDNGVYNIDRKTVNIKWTKTDKIYGISEEYRFTGLDPLKRYRTEVLVLNYGTTYQNSTTSVDGDGDHADDYNAKDFEAIYPENSKWTTFVNAYLTFEPASYFQPVEVDATLIGENLRPDETLVQILYKATGTDNNYQVISQHTVEPYGIEVGMGADGMDDADYGYYVWNSLYNGSLYDYQVHLDKIEDDEVSTWPVSVVYGSPSRYSPLNDAATGVLQVKLIPNRYDIIFHDNYSGEGADVISNEIHIWSYKTDIDYTPVRDGYIFLGWYNNPECTGEEVTAIADSVAENTSLYAKWDNIKDYTLTVKHVDKNNTNNVLSYEVKESQGYDDVIKAESLIKTFDGYSYDSASAESIKITKESENNVITLYYTANSYKYTVNYYEKGTEVKFAESKHGEALYGSEVVEQAVYVKGYVAEESIKTVNIKDDENKNVINFYYIPATFGYTVNYLKEGTGEAIAGAKLGTGVFGSSVTETAAIIAGYTLVGGTDTKSITIDTENNVINFYYTVNSYGYTVNYLEEGTDNVIAPSNTGEADFGATVYAKAEIVDGYTLVSDDEQSIVVDVKNNIINFYYKANSYSYTVYYLEQNTGKELHAPKIAVADYGTKVLEFANTIYDYVVVGHGSETITIGTKDNEIVFYYLSDIISDKYDNSDGVPDVNQKPIYIVEHYCAEDKVYKLKDIEYFTGDIDENVTATAKTYDGYVYNAAKSTVNGKINAINGRDDILRLRLYYDIDRVGGGESGDESDGIADDTQKKVTYKVEGGTWADGTDTPKFEYVTITNGNGTLDSIPELSEAGEGYEAKGWYIEAGNVFVGTELPSNVSGTNSVVYVYKFKEIVVTPEEPENPDAPEGDIEGDGEIDGDYDYVHKIVFGKTNAIGWYNVSLDGGETYQIVFGNSTLEVDMGTEVIIKAGDLIGGAFTFYVNGDAVKPDENGEIRVVVDGAVLIGALALEVEVPDPEESLNWFQKIIKAIKDFFAKLFGKKK